MRLTRLILFLLGALSTLSIEAPAAVIQSFTGDLRNDATFTFCGSGCTLGAGNSESDFAQWAGVERDFTIAAFSSVQAVTFSYGGGTNGRGAAVTAGGFEPYLSLFSSSGAFLASTYFGVTCPSGANPDAGSGQCFDVLLDGGVLAPGTYAIVISAFANMSFAENRGTGTLGDGLAGLGNLAFGEDLHYAFDVSAQDASPVPEPKAPVLIAVGVLLLVTIRRRINEN